MEQYRVSWEMWPHEWPRAHRTEKVYDDEAAARDHLAGLKSMEADHPPRPCSDHVWGITLEVRETADWQPARVERAAESDEAHTDATRETS